LCASSGRTVSSSGRRAEVVRKPVLFVLLRALNYPAGNWICPQHSWTSSSKMRATPARLISSSRLDPGARPPHRCHCRLHSRRAFSRTDITVHHNERSPKRPAQIESDSIVRVRPGPERPPVDCEPGLGSFRQIGESRTYHPDTPPGRVS